jgi:hypothetical protein
MGHRDVVPSLGEGASNGQADTAVATRDQY